MKKIFFNIDEDRLRAGWRILIFMLLFFTIFAFISLSIKTFIPIRIIRSLIGLLVFPVLTLGILWLASRYIDHRKFKGYGVNISKYSWIDFIFGILLSAFLFFIIFFLEKALGWVTIVGYFQNQREGYLEMPFIIPLIMGSIFYIIIGFYEEIVFRAYQITNLTEGLNKRNSNSKKALVGAYILSSIIFSLFHSANPNITFVALINIVLVGLFFGLPYILSGELTMSIALHISWNIFQGLYFGFPVSGEQNNLSIVAIEQAGPAIWTGGAFGPEGGLVTSITVIIGCAFVFLWFKVLRTQ